MRDTRPDYPPEFDEDDEPWSIDGPERIYLQAKGGSRHRTWSADPINGPGEYGEPDTPYVREDVVEAKLSAAADRIEALELAATDAMIAKADAG